MLAQNLRSAAAGARHDHGEPPRGPANDSSGTHALGSALVASPIPVPEPRITGSLFGGASTGLEHNPLVQVDPRAAAPPPHDHCAQHHRFGHGIDLRGPKVPWNGCELYTRFNFFIMVLRIEKISALRILANNFDFERVPMNDVTFKACFFMSTQYQLDCCPRVVAGWMIFK